MEIDTSDNKNGRFQSAHPFYGGKMVVFREQNGEEALVIAGELFDENGERVKTATHSLRELNRLQVQKLLLKELDMI